jgi:hypothetical protein
MSVSAVGSTPIIPTTPERLEAPGPDRDGDDKTAKNTTPVQTTASAPGVGQLLNKLV